MAMLPNSVVVQSPEVLSSDGDFLAVDQSMVAALKERAKLSPKRRCRLCFHADHLAAQQEMLIVMHRDSYVRPHRHLTKVETLAIVEGQCDALLFDDVGNVTKVISMSPCAEGGSFFYRMPAGHFHTLVFRSEWLAFVETTVGPFDRSTTEEANWAPPESEPQRGHDFLSRLKMLDLDRIRS